MRIDLHAHSTASDGTDTPAELVTAAAAAGIDVLAITDHDTTEGWAQAALARPDSLVLVRGTEFSTAVPLGDRRISVHLLGYLFDPADPAVVTEHTRQVAERLRRGVVIVERMVADGVPISADQVLTIAAGAPIGRPHIGRALVQAGLVETVSEAFGSYLSGRSGYYVPKLDQDLAAAVEMITAAGGAAVIAHPRGRGESRVLTPEYLRKLAELGLAGLEVDHPDHSAADRAELAGIAADLGLIVTGSSDYHGHNKSIALGAHTTTPEALAALVARTSGVTPLLGSR